MKIWYGQIKCIFPNLNWLVPSGVSCRQWNVPGFLRKTLYSHIFNIICCPGYFVQGYNVFWVVGTINGTTWTKCLFFLSVTWSKPWHWQFSKLPTEELSVKVWEDTLNCQFCLLYISQTYFYFPIKQVECIWNKIIFMLNIWNFSLLLQMCGMYIVCLLLYQNL